MKGTTFYFSSFIGGKSRPSLFTKRLTEVMGALQPGLAEESLTCEFRFVFMIAELTSDRHYI